MWLHYDLVLLPSSTLSSKYGHFWLQKAKMATAKMPNSRFQNSNSQTNGWRHSGYMSTSIMQSMVHIQIFIIAALRFLVHMLYTQCKMLQCQDAPFTILFQTFLHHKYKVLNLLFSIELQQKCTVLWTLSLAESKSSTSRYLERLQINSA